MDTPERAATIKAWATHLNVTHGAIMRDVMNYGLASLVGRFEREHEELPQDVYAAALKLEQDRGAARAAAGAEVKRTERALTKRRPAKRAPRKAAA